MKVKSYEELIAWQRAMLLAKMVYGGRISTQRSRVAEKQRLV